MDLLSVDINIENNSTGAANNILLIKARINNKVFEDILDVHEFFRTLINTGVFEYFTCPCGDFGCGGFYSEVTHSDECYMLQNLYCPEDDYLEDEPVEIFTYNILWRNVINVADEIISRIEDFMDNNELDLLVGTLGKSARVHIRDFKNILNQVKSLKPL